MVDVVAVGVLNEARERDRNIRLEAEATLDFRFLLLPASNDVEDAPESEDRKGCRVEIAI